MIVFAQIPDPSPDFSGVQANLWWIILVFLVLVAVVTLAVRAWMRRVDNSAADVDADRAPEVR